MSRSVASKLLRFRPTCDVCNKKVEECDLEFVSGRDAVHVIVRCHGEKEECTVSGSAMREALHVEARAFVRQKIDEKKQLPGG